MRKDARKSLLLVVDTVSGSNLSFFALFGAAKIAHLQESLLLRTVDLLFALFNLQVSLRPIPRFTLPLDLAIIVAGLGS